MYTLSKEFKFEAAHQLMNHDGKCSRLHGHSWKGKLTLQSESLVEAGPKKGMVVDYGEMSKHLKEMVERYLDHHHLNDTLETDSPTSEYVAKWVFDYMELEFGSLLYSVEIQETCTSSCTYSRSKLKKR